MHTTTFGIQKGFIAGAIACVTAVAFAGGGHGSYLPAKILFPYTMISVYWLHSITSPFAILAFIQFPFYGWLTSRFSGLPKGRVVLWAVAAFHLIAVGVLFAFPLESFP